MNLDDERAELIFKMVTKIFSAIGALMLLTAIFKIATK